jgi:hypothetical protein
MRPSALNAAWPALERDVQIGRLALEEIARACPLDVRAVLSA